MSECAVVRGSVVESYLGAGSWWLGWDCWVEEQPGGMAAAVGKGSGVGWAMSSEVHRPGWGVHTPSLYLRHVLIFPEPGFLWCKSGLETPLLEVTGVRRVLVQSLCLVIRTCHHGIMAAKELYELLNFKECRMGSGRSPLALVLVQWVSVAVATRNDNLLGAQVVVWGALLLLRPVASVALLWQESFLPSI